MAPYHTQQLAESRQSSSSYSKERSKELHRGAATSRSSTSHHDRGDSDSHHARPLPNWRTREDGPASAHRHPYHRSSARDWRSRDNDSLMTSSFSSASTARSPTKGDRNRGSAVSGAPRRGAGGHQGRDRGGEVQVDWKEVEGKAKEKGFAVPTDIVEEFKRQGHYDQLRRQLLNSFQSSTQKQELLSSVSSLLLSYFQTSEHEAARLGRLEDSRLQESECLKILEMDHLPRQSRRDGPDPASAPLTGPEIFAGLVKKLLHGTGEGVPAEDSLAKNTESRDRNDVSGILSPDGIVGKAVRERVETLLREEIREKEKIVAPGSPADANTAATAQQETTETAPTVNVEGGEPSKDGREPEDKVDEDIRDAKTADVAAKAEDEVPAAMVTRADGQSRD